MGFEPARTSVRAGSCEAHPGPVVTRTSPQYCLDESAAEGGSPSLVLVHRHLTAVHEAPILTVRTKMACP